MIAELDCSLYCGVGSKCEKQPTTNMVYCTACGFGYMLESRKCIPEQRVICPPGSTLIYNRCMHEQVDCSQYCGSGSTCRNSNNRIICTSCGQGDVLNRDSCVAPFFNCALHCGAGSSCSNVDNGIVCTSCGHGRILHGTLCVAHHINCELYCGEGSACQKINSQVICTSCGPNYFLSGQSCQPLNCIATCGAGSTCSYINGRLTCLTCGPGFTLDAERCQPALDCTPHCGLGSICRVNNRQIECISCGVGKSLIGSRCSEEWGSWGPWSECSHKCGGGRQRRTRDCLTAARCEGNSREQRECNMDVSCGVDCNWCAWSSPSVTNRGQCKMQIMKTRSPNCPPASGNGRACFGPNTEETTQLIEKVEEQSLGFNTEFPEGNKFSVRCLGGCLEIVQVV